MSQAPLADRELLRHLGIYRTYFNHRRDLSPLWRLRCPSIAPLQMDRCLSPGRLRAGLALPVLPETLLCGRWTGRVQKVQSGEQGKAQAAQTPLPAVYPHPYPADRGGFVPWHAHRFLRISPLHHAGAPGRRRKRGTPVPGSGSLVGRPVVKTAPLRSRLCNALNLRSHGLIAMASASGK